jgi:predicted nucleic acid-binding protein
MEPDNRPCFLDTSYLLALVNTRDQWHPEAMRWESRLAAQKQPLITTDYILVELADGLAAVRFRQRASSIVAALQASSAVTIIGASSQLLETALALYAGRPDKNWGLTDCTSFVVMGEQRVTSALTTDEHFRQAGYRALLLEN